MKPRHQRVSEGRAVPAPRAAAARPPHIAEELLLADLRLLDAKLAELERLVDEVDLFLWDEELS